LVEDDFDDVEDDRDDFCGDRSNGSNKAMISATSEMRLNLRYPEHDGIVLGIIRDASADEKKK
jgi:hypothetical protein